MPYGLYLPDEYPDGFELGRSFASWRLPSISGARYRAYGAYS
jgi:hypothetical protein